MVYDDFGHPVFDELGTKMTVGRPGYIKVALGEPCTAETGSTLSALVVQ